MITKWINFSNINILNQVWKLSCTWKIDAIAVSPKENISSTSCIIDDYVLNRRSSLLFNEVQFQAVINQWNKTDPLLLELQHFEAFKGKDTWDKLEPNHFRMLIATTLTARDNKLGKKDIFNEHIPLVQSLYFLLMGLVYCIQRKTDLAVDTIRMMRINDIEVSFEFTISMIADTKPKMKLPDPPKFGLQVIVDNTI